MKGIILAAGRGSRMGDLTDNFPKCRTFLHGKELIQWQIDAMKKAGIDEISIVRGYLADTFKFDLTYFENERWSQTNMVTSLVAAKEWLETGTCITSYSDIVYSADAVKRLINFPGDIVITYDPNWSDLWKMRFTNPLTDAETFQLDGHRVIEIGHRASFVQEIEGQYMGLVKYTSAGWTKVKEYLNTFTQAEIDNFDITKLLQGLVEVGVVVNAVAIMDKWFEVDTESDLKIYNSKYKTSPIM
ncbi:phosphocholine cytidylyltransferase family protein [Alphaproteobacteria bacterium]|nr:phosphocholine cytidylyltransferase family protein [Alphaproteobacteria bacterium]MDC1023088.1 phosphocholine cytidylyltransferase family protein [Alphaproteobacteria bacterium]